MTVVDLRPVAKPPARTCAAKPWLSVVIPAFDEERRLPPTLTAVLAYLRRQQRPFEVVVADDGSSDATADVARAAGPEVRVVRIEHAGKGAAVRAGVLDTTGDLVLVCDADLSTPIEDLDPLRGAVAGGAALAVGSRRLDSSRVELPQPLHRRIMGKVFNLAVQALVLRGVKDTQCGFKLFRGDLAREIFSVARVDGFAFDVEAILLARRLGGRVAEVAVEWYDAEESRVKAVRDSAAMFAELLRIRRTAGEARRLFGECVVVVAPARTSWRPGEGAAMLAASVAVYLAVGTFLVLHEHLLKGDAYSRVAIANRILFSRDPHLAAIGFVWSPLPMVALLPLIPLKAVWPGLTAYGFSASLVSALCMAGAARELLAFLREIGVRPAGRLALTLGFAAHPMIILYAANGMSEAMFVLFLLMASRRLSGWLRSGQVPLGVGAGFALAAAYLTRYETLVAGAAAVALVTAVSYRRAAGSPRQRLGAAVGASALLGVPLAAAFLLWVLASWIVTGNPMEQFSSTYGNSAQLNVRDAWNFGAGGVSAFTASQLLLVEPFVVPLMVIGSVRAWRLGWSADMLAPVGVMGGVLAFMLWSNIRGLLNHELRYMIVAIPLSALAAGAILSRRPSRTQPVVSSTPSPQGRAGASSLNLTARLRRPAGIAVGALTLLMLGSALPVSAYELPSSRLNPGEGEQLRAMHPVSEQERRAALRFATERQIANDLDAMNLPPGSVLLDDFYGFAIPLNSKTPKQFVITSDRDFKTILNDPAAFDVQYVLVPQPKGLGLLDAVNRRYPSMYASGEGSATLVRQYTSSADGYNWRLYRLKREA